MPRKQHKRRHAALRLTGRHSRRRGVLLEVVMVGAPRHSVHFQGRALCDLVREPCGAPLAGRAGRWQRLCCCSGPWPAAKHASGSHSGGGGRAGGG